MTYPGVTYIASWAGSVRACVRVSYKVKSGYGCSIYIDLLHTDLDSQQYPTCGRGLGFGLLTITIASYHIHSAVNCPRTAYPVQEDDIIHLAVCVRCLRLWLLPPSSHNQTGFLDMQVLKSYVLTIMCWLLTFLPTDENTWTTHLKLWCHCQHGCARHSEWSRPEHIIPREMSIFLFRHSQTLYPIQYSYSNPKIVLLQLLRLDR